MDRNVRWPNSHFQQQCQPPWPPQQYQEGTATSPVNGILSNMDTVPHTVCPLSVPSAVSPQSEIRRARKGRPRKYETPKQEAAGKKRGQSSGGASPSPSSKRSRLAAIGQGYTPCMITVAAGKDVAKEVMLFMQKTESSICVLSASGSILDPTLLQPGTSSISITFKGLFEILSLSGYFIHTEVVGRASGLKICLSSAVGKVIGGKVGETMTAGTPVQVIFGEFLIDPKKDIISSVKDDASTGRLPSAGGGASTSNLCLQAAQDPFGRIGSVNNNDQSMGGNQSMIHPWGMLAIRPQVTDWRVAGGTNARRNVSYGLAGNRSPES